MLLRIIITVRAADLHWKHRHPVTQCFSSTLLCKKRVWAGALERFWLLTSVFLFTRCPNQLETSSLSLKPLTSSQQTVRTALTLFIALRRSVSYLLLFSSPVIFFQYFCHVSLKHWRKTHQVLIWNRLKYAFIVHGPLHLIIP